MILFLIIHTVILFLYILFLPYSNFEPKSRFRYKGNLEDIVSGILSEKRLDDVDWIKTDSGGCYYHSQEKRITFVQGKEGSYSEKELFGAVHEIMHAEQDENGFILYKVRKWWSEKVKIFFLGFFLVWLLMTIFNGMESAWLVFSILIAFHYLYSIVIVFGCELHANHKAYLYVKDVFQSSQKELKVYNKQKWSNSLYYLVTIPALLVLR